MRVISPVIAVIQHRIYRILLNQKQNPLLLGSRGFDVGGLAETYFHTGICTIIGAESFHGPVREGKGWYQLAMAAKQKGVEEVKTGLDCSKCRNL